MIAGIKKVYWHEVREQVLQLEPALAAIIDKLSPDENFPLFKAIYPYGKKIVDKGNIQIPTSDGAVFPIDAPFVPKEIASSMQRRSAPLSLLLTKAAEVFFEMIDKIVTLSVISPGMLFGLWDNLDGRDSFFAKRLWNITAGARSLYMLPKITDIGSHKVLRKKYGMHSHPPKNLIDHWHVFSEIANSHEFTNNWHSEILFFADIWMDTARNDSAWNEFYLYILQHGWDQSQYWRNKVSFDVVWDQFTHQLIKQNIKPNPYLISIVKHIVLVGTGVLPGSVAAAQTDVMAPIKQLQKIYIEDYKLKDYIPTFMLPKHRLLSDNVPTYYSLQQPVLLEAITLLKRTPSVLSIMPEIMFLMDTFQAEVLQGSLKAENTPVDTFAKNIMCTYFHSEGNGVNRIYPTAKMPETDSRLLSVSSKYKDRVFCENGHFIRGCVRLTSSK